MGDWVLRHRTKSQMGRRKRHVAWQPSPPFQQDLRKLERWQANPPTLHAQTRPPRRQAILSHAPNFVPIISPIKRRNRPFPINNIATMHSIRMQQILLVPLPLASHRDTPAQTSTNIPLVSGQYVDRHERNQGQILLLSYNIGHRSNKLYFSVFSYRSTDSLNPSIKTDTTMANLSNFRRNGQNKGASGTKAEDTEEGKDYQKTGAFRKRRRETYIEQHIVLCLSISFVTWEILPSPMIGFN